MRDELRAGEARQQLSDALADQPRIGDPGRVAQHDGPRAFVQVELHDAGHGVGRQIA
jgi:hypothetical protein